MVSSRRSFFEFPFADDIADRTPAKSQDRSAGLRPLHRPRAPTALAERQR
jgi:hypothetical protein